MEITPQNFTYTITAEEDGKTASLSGLDIDDTWYRENPNTPTKTVVCNIDTGECWIEEATTGILTGKVIIYPNPYRADMGCEEKIIFDTLPSETKIWIYTIMGKLVKKVDVKGTRWEWNIDKIPSGIYIYLIKADEFKSKGKITIIK